MYLCIFFCLTCLCHNWLVNKGTKTCIKGSPAAPHHLPKSFSCNGNGKKNNNQALQWVSGGEKSISYCREAPLNTNGGQALAEEKGEEKSGMDECSWHCEGRWRWGGRKRRATDAAAEWKGGSEEDSVRPSVRQQQRRRRKCVENMFAQPKPARSCNGSETHLPP